VRAIAQKADDPLVMTQYQALRRALLVLVEIPLRQHRLDTMSLKATLAAVQPLCAEAW
jgi:hypothetical protein